MEIEAFINKIPLHVPFGLIAANFIALTINIIRGNRARFGKSSVVFVISKVLICPLGFLAYYWISKSLDWYMILYYLGSWIGDILLLNDTILFTLIGGACFIVSHISSIFMFHVDWKQVPYWGYFLMMPGLIVHFSLLIPKLKFKHYTDYGVVFYVSALELAASSAVGRLSHLEFLDYSFLLVWIGYLFFLISDFFLLMNQLKIDPVPRRYEIMITYALAQMMVGPGMALEKIRTAK